MTQNSGEQDGQQQRRPMRLENSVFSPGNQRRCGFSINTGESKIQKSLEGNAESDEYQTNCSWRKLLYKQIFDNENKKSISAKKIILILISIKTNQKFFIFVSL